MMVASQVFPVLNVAQQAGVFGRIPLSQMARHTQGGERASGASYQRDTIQFENDSWATQEFGFEEKVDDRLARVYRTFLEAEQFATSRALNKILTRNEMRVAAMFNSSDYTSASMVVTKGNGKWDTAGGTMLEDINSGCELVYFATGLKPNVLIISEIAVNRIRIKNSQLLDAIKSAGAGQAAKPSDITAALLAQATGMDRVIIAGASKNTAGPAAAASIAQIWGNHAIVARVATTNDIQEPCVGRTFHWSDDDSRPLGVVESYEEPQTRSTIIRARHETQEKQLQLKCAAMILDVI